MQQQPTPRNSVRPSRRNLWVIAVIAFIALIKACLQLFHNDTAALENALQTVLEGLIIAAVILFLVDFGLSFWRKSPNITRSATDILPVGHWATINLSISNPNNYEISLRLKDHTPTSVEVESSTQPIKIEKNQLLKFQFRIRPKQRGKIQLGPIQILQASALGFWERSIFIPCLSEIKVYPDFASVQHFSLLLQDNLQGQSGMKLLHRRGEGQDFHQLREYRQGDSLRQLDWKATARINKLISREYQDERDQTIFFVLDCGRRMRTKDGELSHFDHALNSILLLSFVALRQGDSVGLMAFGGTPRYLAPIKSIGHMNTLLNTVYDLHSTTNASDYQAATLEFLQKVKKRSLVIYVTNVRNENFQEVPNAVALLKKNHIVLIANLQESVLEQTLIQQPETFEQALTWIELNHYLTSQNKNDELLKSQSVMNIRTTPAKLPIALINSYWEIKRAGKL